jgi:DNA polymerase III subunit delta
MVAIAAKDIPSFLKDGFKRYPIILFYGPDDGLVSENAELIAKQTVLGDNANIVRLDGDAVAGDPMMLSDEANAISMFGGVRAIRIRITSMKSLIPALEPLLAKPPQDACILLEAGDIKKNHALRATIEKNASCAAVACYAEEGRTLSAWLDSAAQEQGYSFDSDARQALLETIGLDRKRSRSEVEKLFLYCLGNNRIGLEDVEAVITDAAVLSADMVIDATFLGQLDTIETEARRVLADGMDASVLLGFALRHALLLLSITDQIAEGRSASESVKAHHVHWKRERNLVEQSGRWTSQRLQRAVQIINEATLNTRKLSPLGEALAIRALWSLALAVSRRQ